MTTQDDLSEMTKTIMLNIAPIDPGGKVELITHRPFTPDEMGDRMRAEAEITIHSMSGPKRVSMWFALTVHNRPAKRLNRAAMEVLRRPDTTVVSWGSNMLLHPTTKATANISTRHPVFFEVSREDWYEVCWGIEAVNLPLVKKIIVDTDKQIRAMFPNRSYMTTHRYDSPMRTWMFVFRSPDPRSIVQVRTAFM